MSITDTPLTNWAGNVVFAATRMHEPGTLDELRRVVARARHVRALGGGHSFNRIADTSDELVRLDRLPRTVEIDSAASTVSVGGGMRYAEVTVALQRAGHALGNLASLPHISIAGACATGTHGSGDTRRGLSAAVSALQLVGPDGDLVELSRAADPGVFPGTVVALGALGIVTRLTLEIEPTFEVAQRVHVGVPLDKVTDRLDEVFGAAYSVSLFTDWRGGEASVWLKHRVGGPETAWAWGRPAAEPMHPVPGMSTEFCTEQLGVAGPWHERLPHFRHELDLGAADELQSEFFLARDAAPAAFAALRRLGDLLRPVLHIAEVRTVRSDDLWLSPAYGRDTVTFHFTWTKDLAAVLPVIAAVEERLMPLGARPHWGKLTTVAAPEIIARYERAPDFARLRRELDPAGKFGNALVRDLFPGE